MPKNALDNPLVLPILGLLVEQPRHAYAVFSELRGRYEYFLVRNATVYTLLQRLAEEGWVTAANGDDRADLATTELGRTALAERVHQQIREMDLTGGPAFVTALAYLGILQPPEAAAVLEERVERIRERIRQLELSVRSTAEPEVHMIEAHYLLSRLRHDVDWLESTVQRIETGELGWVH